MKSDDRSSTPLSDLIQELIALKDLYWIREGDEHSRRVINLLNRTITALSVHSETRQITQAAGESADAAGPRATPASGMESSQGGGKPPPNTVASSAGVQTFAPAELLDKCIMALSGEYVEKPDDAGEEWNAAVGYCIGKLRVMQEQLPAVAQSAREEPKP